MPKEDLSSKKSSKTAAPIFIPMNLLEMNKKCLDTFIEAQTEFLSELQEMNLEWALRASSEANLTSEFVGKLTAARSLPAAAAAYQDWIQQHMQLFAEDGRRFMSNGQKFMQASAQAFSNGLPASGT